MPAAVEMLGYEWDPCFVHIFNNIIQDYMKNICNISKKANVRRKKKYVIFLATLGIRLKQHSIK